MQTPDWSTWRNAQKRTSPPGSLSAGFFLLAPIGLIP